MNDLDMAAALKAAHHMADMARPIARKYWLAPKDMKLKADKSFLTPADLEIERQWRNHLETQFPDHAILGEEFGHSAGKASYTWVLDPIDGTRHFAMGLGGFATLIALCDAEGHPLLGMIDLPLMDARYVGVRGQGAWLNDTALKVSGESDLSQALAMLANQSSFGGADARAYEALRAAVSDNTFDAGSPAYGALAAGKLDLCINGSDLDAFDICALVPVVEEAGGVITGRNGEALGLLSKGVILASASAALHAAALKVVQEA